MILHHYTSFHTFLAIFESKKIRFNRLDKVDDPSEAKLYKHKNFAKSLFTSSWTTSFNSQEMWEKYGDDGKGVIISLPSMMFDRHEVHSDGFYLIVHNSPAFSPIPVSQMITDRFVLTPVIEWSNFFKKVEYVENLELLRLELSDLINFKRGSAGFGVKASSNITRIQDIARFKESIWSYQNEYRFVIQLNLILKFKYPFLKINDALLDSMNYHFDNNNFNSSDDPRDLFTYIDIPLGEDAFNKMEITYTNKLSESNQELIKDIAFKIGIKIRCL